MNVAEDSLDDGPRDADGPRDVSELEELLSRPTPPVVQALDSLPGDLLVLGAGGKMGPTLTRMARRATEQTSPRRVIAASRFGNADIRKKLESHGIETIASDLLAPGALEQLPDAENIVYMPAVKFGTQTDAARTWTVNCVLPSMVCRRFARSRIAAFSTGNVYPLAPVTSTGSQEADELAPIGEYAMTAVGRERVFEYFSRELDVPVALLRLNYASELRYGVLVDLAGRVLRRAPIDVTMGYVNVLWQGDANAMALAALTLATSPPQAINLAGPEILSVRKVCQTMGRRLGIEPVFEGEEAPDALLSDGRNGRKQLGDPTVRAEQLIAWTVDWVARGGQSLDKPTHFQTRNGAF